MSTQKLLLLVVTYTLYIHCDLLEMCLFYRRYVHSRQSERTHHLMQSWWPTLEPTHHRLGSVRCGLDDHSGQPEDTNKQDIDNHGGVSEIQRERELVYFRNCTGMKQQNRHYFGTIPGR